ncbi:MULTISPECIES: DUF3768 domain-containing protein [unclassified Aureimonas]|uniref:DUF3768 domain-containing protein n=1 Tax=unclassified Aureimonas TaxID=2615206 RepID=UPI0009EB527D|nr:DUF3768 domain-containing protein [Aureimonas sp. Leaf427]
MKRLTPLAGHGHSLRTEAGLSPTAALNDAIRRTFTGGQIMLTDGVASLDPADRLAILDAVRAFDAFTSGCDPYGDHDFGAVEHNGVRYFWKIDAYDRNFAYASPDPADPAVTARVLTIMRADEY